MKRTLIGAILIILTVLNAPCPAQPILVLPALDLGVLRWLKSNISPNTRLPYSFYILPEAETRAYKNMAGMTPIQGVIERTIAKEGLDIYDGAVYQIVLSMIGGKENLEQAYVPLRYYWEGSVGDLSNIRAGYPINLYVYDQQNPSAVSSDPNRLGERGFIFRIIHADGRYLVTDPLDGKKVIPGFPDQDRLHWVDWKPVAGENAWVVMAAMHLYHKKFYDHSLQNYVHESSSIELDLAKELARAAMIMLSETGGIRMAPLGTHRTLEKGEDQYFTEQNWWYNHISTENNISWYAAFRMLYNITGEQEYRMAMDGIEQFLKYVWDEEAGIFHQGACFRNGAWGISREYFALDVQTWAIACLGPQTVDAWLGEGKSYQIWLAAKKYAGVFSVQGDIMGVGYTAEHDRISVEWSAGAMLALQEMTEYYKTRNVHWARTAGKDKDVMRKYMSNFRYHISSDQAAYSYSSRRGTIPFGWNSHDPEVLSLASTGWMIFVDAGFNPFFLDQKS